MPFKRAKRRGGRPLYLKTHYLTPASCGYCEGKYSLIPLIEYERQKGITRKKSTSLLKKRFLLCTWFKGNYHVMENPNNPPSEYEFTHRLRNKRKRSNSRGVYKSEKEYYASERFRDRVIEL